MFCLLDPALPGAIHGSMADQRNLDQPYPTSRTTLRLVPFRTTGFGMNHGSPGLF